MSSACVSPSRVCETPRTGCFLRPRWALPLQAGRVGGLGEGCALASRPQGSRAPEEEAEDVCEAVASSPTSARLCSWWCEWSVNKVTALLS